MQPGLQISANKNLRGLKQKTAILLVSPFSVLCGLQLANAVQFYF